ncbi:MAG: CRTAC1 family protein [Planctomycetes bacterium]|nr:CRTAC1 family protein [Planctomycetota bacterium]
MAGLLSILLASAALHALRAEPAAVPLFIDVARQAGIELPHACEGVAFGDVNGDGRLDLLVAVYDTPAALFLNQGGFRFQRWQPAEGPTPFTGQNMAVVLGDIDNDGDLDACMTRSEENRLYENDGHGRYTDITARAGVGNRGFSRGACFADFNGDGLLDLYVVNSENGPNALYLNRGGNRFEDWSEKSGTADRGDGYGLAAGDVDGDGDTDLFVANMPTPGRPELDDCRLFQNRGGATFKEVGHEAGVAKAGPAHGAHFTDFDNDGDLDLFVCIIAKPNRLYVNDGHGAFSDRAREAGVDDTDQDVGCASGDLDLDGWPDLFVTAWGTNRLYLNRGGLRFVESGREAGVRLESRCTGVALGDLDGDGDLDAYLANYGPDLLYANLARSPEDGGPGHFLIVEAIGRRTNRSGIGVRVSLHLQQPDGGQPAPLLGVREVTAGNGYNSMSAPVAHFGTLHAGPFMLRARFPVSQAEVVLQDVRPDQTIRIEEPAGTP